MRKVDKEIKDKNMIKSILEEALVCRIALCDDNSPYIIPMNFGYKDNYLYLHSAPEGRKIEILRKNNNICFEVDLKTELVTSENACKWGMKYLSVVGFGKAQIVNDIEEKKKALNIIMNKHSNESSFEYLEAAIKNVVIIKVRITELAGKKSGY